MQFVVRRDGNLAVIDCGRRLAAQRNPVIADDVDAHWWVLLIGPATAAAGDPHSRSLRRPKPVYSGLILWRCWATAEHGIAQPKPCSLRHIDCNGRKPPKGGRTVSG